jgi:hypothetical protein
MENTVPRKPGQTVARFALVLCAALVLSGCGGGAQVVRGSGTVIRDVGDDIVRWVGGAAREAPVVDDVAAYKSALIAQLDQITATPEWSQLRQSIQEGVHLTRESPICGLTVDAVTDWDEFSTRDLFETLSDELEGQNDYLGLQQTVDDVVTTFDEADANDPAGTTWRVGVLMFKSLYCA